MKRFIVSFSWNNTFKLLAVAAANLMLLAACQRPVPLLPNQFSAEIPNSALFAKDPTNLRGSVSLRTSRNYRGTTLAEDDTMSCQALTPECMQGRPTGMFVYLANLIRTYYPEWNSFAYLRFGYYMDTAPNSSCNSGKWTINVQGNGANYQVIPFRYENTGGRTRVVVNNRRRLNFEAVTGDSLAGLMLAFRSNQSSCQYYNQPFSWRNSWYWEAPVCNNIMAPTVFISGKFKPGGQIGNGPHIALYCGEESSFSIPLSFNPNQLKFFSSNIPAIAEKWNDLYGWTLQYDNQIYYPWAY